MKTFCTLGCPVLLLVLANVSAGGGEDKIKTIGRTVLSEYKDAVITVKFAGFVEHKNGDAVRKDEFDGELIGTVVSPNGLTVLCNRSFMYTVDPLLDVNEAGPKKEGDADKRKPVLREITFLFGDGRKMAAKVVFADEKVGVLYVAPKEKQTKLKFVQLEKTKTPEVLDRVFMLSRLGEGQNREVEIGVGRVSATLKKPLPALVADFWSDGGCPIFDAAGRPLGISIIWDDKLGKSGGDNLSRSLSNSRSIILPAEALQVSKLAEAINRSEKDEK
jgi:hypothetical protein